MSRPNCIMTPDERLELDIIFAAEHDEQIAVKQRASAVIEALPAAERLATLTGLQNHLSDFTAEDQICELAAWLQRIAR